MTVLNLSRFRCFSGNKITDLCCRTKMDANGEDEAQNETLAARRKCFKLHFLQSITGHRDQSRFTRHLKKHIIVLG